MMLRPASDPCCVCSGHELGFWSSSVCLVVQPVSISLHSGPGRPEKVMDMANGLLDSHFFYKQLAVHFHWRNYCVYIIYIYIYCRETTTTKKYIP